MPNNPDVNIINYEPSVIRQNSNSFMEHECPKTPEADAVISVELKDEICLDGLRVKAGSKVEVSIKQYRALARHMLWLDGPVEHRPIAGNLLHPSATEAFFETRGEKK